MSTKWKFILAVLAIIWLALFLREAIPSKEIVIKSSINRLLVKVALASTQAPKAPPEQPRRKGVDIRAYVEQKAKENGVNPVLADWIVKKESNYDPETIGDHGTSVGLWQIHLPDHPSITKEMAENVEWSTKWAMEQIKNGSSEIWSTVRYCHKWYEDCPL